MGSAISFQEGLSLVRLVIDVAKTARDDNDQSNDGMIDEALSLGDRLVRDVLATNQLDRQIAGRIRGMAAEIRRNAGDNHAARARRFEDLLKRGEAALAVVEGRLDEDGE
ncbi:MAG: hypothetical protein AAGF20_00305 [Pseudomonadota bacterium]